MSLLLFLDLTFELEDLLLVLLDLDLERLVVIDFLLNPLFGGLEILGQPVMFQLVLVVLLPQLYLDILISRLILLIIVLDYGQFLLHLFIDIPFQ